MHGTSLLSCPTGIADPDPAVGTEMIETEAEYQRRHRALVHVRESMAETSCAREGVSVSVRRRAGFQNDVTTPAGKQFLIDEPFDFGGRGEAPDPAELLLAAVGASLSVTITAHATFLEVRLDAISIALSAEIEGGPFFDPDAGGPTGLLDIGIELTICSAASEEDLRKVVDLGWRAAPVLRTLRAEPKLVLHIEKMR